MVEKSSLEKIADLRIGKWPFFYTLGKESSVLRRENSCYSFFCIPGVLGGAVSNGGENPVRRPESITFHTIEFVFILDDFSVAVGTDVFSQQLHFIFIFPVEFALPQQIRVKHSADLFPVSCKMNLIPCHDRDFTASDKTIQKLERFRYFLIKVPA